MVNKNKTDSANKNKRRVRIRISRGTIITICILVAVFAILNYEVFPRLFVITPVKNVTIPAIRQGNLEYIQKQIENRSMIKIPSMTTLPPIQVGKQNPFE